MSEFWSFERVRNTEDKADLGKNQGTRYGLIYIKDDLGDTAPAGLEFVGLPLKLSDQHYERISLSRTRVNNVIFRDCRFDRCHLMGAAFINCEFHNCTFKETNVLKVKFINCYIDPQSFEDCLDPNEHGNIGTHLYKELYRNSVDEGQDDFALMADTLFLRWKRYNRGSKYSRSKEKGKRRKPFTTIRFYAAQSLSVAFDFFTGYGNSLPRMLGSALGLTVLISAINFVFRESFGLGNLGGFWSEYLRMLYYTVISMTTVGYGEINPTTNLGRGAATIQAVIGFITFAFIAATIFKRGSR